MLKIRLQRVGRKHDPSFRLIVTDSRKAPQGAYLEMLGSYDPRIDKKTLNSERISYWVSQGAQVSNTAHNLLISEKIIEGKKRDVASKKNVGKKEAEAAEVKAKEAAAAEQTTKESAKEETAEKAAPAEEKKEEAAAESAEEKKEETPAVSEAPGETEEKSDETPEGKA